jgi:hypothetical protein
MRYKIAFEISKNSSKKGGNFETFHVDKIEITDKAIATAVALGIEEIFKEVRDGVNKNPCQSAHNQGEPEERGEQPGNHSEDVQGK